MKEEGSMAWKEESDPAESHLGLLCCMQGVLSAGFMSKWTAEITENVFYFNPSFLQDCLCLSFNPSPG